MYKTVSWWASAAAMTVLILATVAGNAGVLCGLLRSRRSATHYPLASLAAADLLVGACVLPLAASRELFTFRLSWLICACWSTMDVLCCTASILSLCALGWERWSGITNPLGRARRTKVAKILAALVWPVATAVAVPTVFVKSPELREGVMDKACTVNTNAGYVFFSVSLSFYIPTCVMIVLHGQILQALAAAPTIRSHRGQMSTRSQAGSTNQGPQNNLPSTKGRQQNPAANPGEPSSAPIKVPTSPGVTSRQRQATNTIIRLMSLFLVCWSPFFIMLPIDSLCECVSDTMWQWCTWLGYTNSALNPVVYAAAAPSVGRAFNAVLRRMLPKT